jgi:hypothetical protein
MSKADEHRKKASEAKAMAEGLTDEFSKALWLEVAENWLRMVPKAKRTREQQFTDAEREQGTGQGKIQVRTLIVLANLGL